MRSVASGALAGSLPPERRVGERVLGVHIGSARAQTLSPLTPRPLPGPTLPFGREGNETSLAFDCGGATPC